MKPKIAVTYSPNTGGPVLSLRKIIPDLQAELVDCDYRKIVPQSNEIEEIYISQEKMFKIFQKAKQKAKDFLKDIDCLILSGSPAMIDPRLFSQPLNGDKIDLERAIAELALTHIAMQMGMPILGVCGGHQLVNVYLGGTIGDLNEEDLLKQGFDQYGKIKVDANSEFAKIINPKLISGNNSLIFEKFFGSHFQVIATLGGKNRIRDKNDYLKVCARADDSKGNIEAVEGQYGAPLLGIQFHPEVGVKGYSSTKLPENISGTIYQAESEEAILKNKRIFAAFIKSAESFHNKKRVNSQIKTKDCFFASIDKDTTIHQPQFAKQVVKNENLNKADLSNHHSVTPPLSLTISPETAESIREGITNQFIQNRIHLLQDKKTKNKNHNQINNICLTGFFNKLPTNIVSSSELEGTELASVMPIRP